MYGISRLWECPFNPLLALRALIWAKMNQSPERQRVGFFRALNTYEDAASVLC